MSPNEAVPSPPCEFPNTNSVRLEFSYQLRDFDQAKTQLRRRYGVDRTFYLVTRTLIWTLLTPILIIAAVSLFMWLHSQIAAGFVVFVKETTIVLALVAAAAVQLYRS